MDQSKLSRKDFGEMVKQASPNSHLIRDCLKAFFVGGAICLLGQILQNWLLYLGLDKETSALATSVTLIFLAAMATGLGLYGDLGRFAGAGSVVPITGFSNSVAAPAIEYKKEGLVFGTGARMFTVAGPVILYGTATAAVVGVIYYFVTQVI